jgi:CheY-like chemotaxis protein
VRRSTQEGIRELENPEDSTPDDARKWGLPVLVLVLALMNCIIGVELGLRYRVWVVPPLLALVLPEIGLLAVHDEPWSFWGVAGLITSLQIGYLLGSAALWLPLPSADPEALTRRHEPVDVRLEPVPIPIAALKILVIEDEIDVSVLAEQMLRELGCEVVWSCSSAAEAVALLRERRPDAAVLDIKLKGESVYPVAVLLDAANIPFVFASGDYSSVPTTWEHRPRIQKPFGLNSLADGLASALDARARAAT